MNKNKQIKQLTNTIINFKSCYKVQMDCISKLRQDVRNKESVCNNLRDQITTNNCSHKIWMQSSAKELDSMTIRKDFFKKAYKKQKDVHDAELIKILKNSSDILKRISE